MRGLVTADDLVNRKVGRKRPNELWVTDITEHPTREGKVYCCCVMDTSSRKIIGWSIDSVQNSSLVVNALDMAIKNRRPAAGGMRTGGRQGVVCVRRCRANRVDRPTATIKAEPLNTSGTQDAAPDSVSPLIDIATKNTPTIVPRTL